MMPNDLSKTTKFAIKKHENRF